MAWTTPLTAVDGAELTAAQWNASVRDNLNETAVAKATASGRLIVPSGPKSMVERIPTSGAVITTETSSSTSYANLATVGPDVIVTTGSKALLILTAGMAVNTANQDAYYAFVCSNATAINPDDDAAIRHTSATANASVVSTWAYLRDLSPGQNEFRARYRVTGGTGSWDDRRLSVVPF